MTGSTEIGSFSAFPGFLLSGWLKADRLQVTKMRCRAGRDCCHQVCYSVFGPTAMGLERRHTGQDPPDT